MASTTQRMLCMLFMCIYCTIAVKGPDREQVVLSNGELHTALLRREPRRQSSEASEELPIVPRLLEESSLTISRGLTKAADGSFQSPSRGSAIRVVRASSCTGDDCVSRADCPQGFALTQCVSDPPNAGDGVRAMTNGTCIAYGGSDGVAITAVATCDNNKTSFVVDSSEEFQTNRLVVAACPTAKIISCLCWSPWTVKDQCSGSSVFPPDSSMCTRAAPASGGIRVFALCDGDAAKEAQDRRDREKKMADILKQAADRVQQTAKDFDVTVRRLHSEDELAANISAAKLKAMAQIESEKQKQARDADIAQNASRVRREKLVQEMKNTAEWVRETAESIEKAVQAVQSTTSNPTVSLNTSNASLQLSSSNSTVVGNASNVTSNSSGKVASTESLTSSTTTSMTTSSTTTSTTTSTAHNTTAQKAMDAKGKTDVLPENLATTTTQANASKNVTVASDQSQSAEGAKKTGAIVGGVVGAICVVVVLLAGGCWYYGRRAEAEERERLHAVTTRE
jgi:hypothetical protein